MKVVYIIGPFRADSLWQIEENIRFAEVVGKLVLEAGAMPIIPHANTRLYFMHIVPESIILEGTREILRRCDMAVTTQGDAWEDSEGSVGEVELARELNIPVLTGWCCAQDVEDFIRGKLPSEQAEYHKNESPEWVNIDRVKT